LYTRNTLVSVDSVWLTHIVLYGAVGPDSPKPQRGNGRSSSNEPLPDPRAAPTIPAPPYAKGGDSLAVSAPMPATVAPGSDLPDALAVQASGTEI
jgi:hypothetical protein